MAIYKINGVEYHVPVEVVSAALTAYDMWVRALTGEPISRDTRLAKIGEIAALIHPRTSDDYYRPDRLRKVMLSEIGKRKNRVVQRPPKPKPRQLDMFDN